MSSLLHDIATLFVPATCAVCGRLLCDDEEVVCADCLAEAPLTGYAARADNPMFSRFWGIVPVERASAQIFYIKGSGWQRAIHDFKYRSSWQTARYCGRWMADTLLESNLYYDIDLVVPVPLHRRKLLSRGYNQSAYIAEGFAERYECGLSTGNLVRLRPNSTQTTHTYHERWLNVAGIFGVRRPEEFEGKHILLVDDVFTTGATIMACAEALLAAVPTARISVATFAAVSKYQL